MGIKMELALPPRVMHLYMGEVLAFERAFK
jgi:hypothetical protein